MISLERGLRLVELPDAPKAKPRSANRAAGRQTAFAPVAAASTPGRAGSLFWLLFVPLSAAFVLVGASVLPRRTLASAHVLRLIEPRRLDLGIAGVILFGSILIALAVTRTGG